MLLHAPPVLEELAAELTLAVELALEADAELAPVVALVLDPDAELTLEVPPAPVVAPEAAVVAPPVADVTAGPAVDSASFVVGPLTPPPLPSSIRRPVAHAARSAATTHSTSTPAHPLVELFEFIISPWRTFARSLAGRRPRRVDHRILSLSWPGHERDVARGRINWRAAGRGVPRNSTATRYLAGSQADPSGDPHRCRARRAGFSRGSSRDAAQRTARGDFLLRETGPMCDAEGMVTVNLTRHLHSFFPQLEGKDIAVEASTVGEVVRALEGVAPGIGFYICDEHGGLRKHVNIFVDKQMIRDRRGLSDAVAPGDQVHILQALSGG